MHRLIAALLLISCLCACGRTGDLYLPEDAQPGAEPESVSAEDSELDEQTDEEENE